MRHGIFALGLVSVTLLGAPVACSDDPAAQKQNPAAPQVETKADAGSDAAPVAPRAAPAFDPNKGSFVAARASVEALVALGRKGELAAPNRFFPMRDPLFIMSAMSEVRREATTTDCVASQAGCPSASAAKALVDEYLANKASLGGALKKVLAAQHAWGRIALAETLLTALNLLEQAGALGVNELAALVADAGTLASALATPTTTPVGIYPELSPNAAYYRLAFQQVRPAPAPAQSHIDAANTFIDAVLGRLAIGPKPEDPASIGPKPEDPTSIGPKPEDPFSIGPKPEDPLGLVAWRLKRGLSDQGVDFRGTVSEGSGAARTLEALAYFIIGKTTDPSAADGYLTTIDTLLPKVADGSITNADWITYGGAADKLAAAFDVSAGALSGSELVTGVAAPAKPATGGLEDDPNVTERVSTDVLLRDGAAALLAEAPFLQVEVWGPAPAVVGDRRSPIVMPAGIDVSLPSRAPVPAPALGELVAVTSPTFELSWIRTLSSTPLDHVDVRIENLTTSKVVFHKIYRRAADGTIATRTALPAEPAWLAPGSANELQVRASAVDRLGHTSGIVCTSIALELDPASKLVPVPTSGSKCFDSALDLGEAPLATAATSPSDVVIGRYLGTPYRPALRSAKTSFTIYNDTATPRRLTSLFTPDYSEILPGVDRNVRKPDDLAPIDTGVIAPFATVTVNLPANTPRGYTFALFDPDNTPTKHLQILNDPEPVPLYW
ncbi:MAG: hypothetical protein U0270_29250 [Labilithrix sp.]